VGDLGKWLRTLPGLVGSLSVYAAVCVSSGALAGLVAYVLERDPHLPFFLCALLPIGPLYVYFSSGRVVSRRLELLREWKNRNLITEEQHQRMVEALLQWVGERWAKVIPPGAPPPDSSRREPL